MASRGSPSTTTSSSRGSRPSSTSRTAPPTTQTPGTGARASSAAAASGAARRASTISTGGRTVRLSRLPCVDAVQPPATANPRVVRRRPPALLPRWRCRVSRAATGAGRRPEHRRGVRSQGEGSGRPRGGAGSPRGPASTTGRSTRSPRPARTTSRSRSRCAHPSPVAGSSAARSCWSSLRCSGRRSMFLLKNNAALYALTRQTGKVRWKKKLGHLAASAPAVGHNTVYAVILERTKGEKRGRVVALSAKDGRTRWSRKLPSRAESSPFCTAVVCTSAPRTGRSSRSTPPTAASGGPRRPRAPSRARWRSRTAGSSSGTTPGTSAPCACGTASGSGGPGPAAAPSA